MTTKLLVPDFIVVGAHRSGTTSLYYWLKEHPQVFMSPVKETNYFSRLKPPHSGPGDDEGIDKPLERNSNGLFSDRLAGIVSSWNDYMALFSGSEQFLVRGEISPSYLYYPIAASLIREKLPDCKIIIVLRNPIERAFSNYKILIKGGREYLDFEKALELEEERIRSGWEFTWALKGLGLYYLQVRYYLDSFPEDQVGIWLYENLKIDPKKFYQEICNFIGIDTRFNPDFSRHNVSRPEIGKLHRFLSKYRNFKKIVRKLVPSKLRSILSSIDNSILAESLMMNPETRKYLLEYYRDDIMKLQKLLPQLNFTSWIEEEERKLNRAQ